MATMMNICPRYIFENGPEGIKYSRTDGKVIYENCIKEVNEMTVSNIIADVLKSKGISQAFLAEKSGIPYKRINYIVTENGDVKNDEIFKIASALNMDVNFFNPNSKKIGEEE